MEPEKRESPIYSIGDDEFNQFFARKEAEQEDFEIKMYRVTRKGAKTYKTWLRDYVDEVPTELGIAQEYGGGQFWLVAYDGTGRKLERRMFIDSIWSTRLDEKNKVAPGPPVPPAHRPDPMEYVSKIFSDVITPLLRFTQSQKQQTPDNMAEFTTTLMEKMTSSLITSMSKIQNMVIDNQMDNLIEKPVIPPPIEDNSKNELIKEVLEIAKSFGAKFLEANGVRSKMFETIIKSDEKFDTIHRDPELADAIYTAAVNDPDIGEEKAKKLFTKLGFTNP